MSKSISKKSFTKNKRIKKLSNIDINLFAGGGNTISYNPGAGVTSYDTDEITNSLSQNSASQILDAVKAVEAANKAANTAANTANTVNNITSGLSLGLNSGSYGSTLANSLSSGLNVGASLGNTATSAGLNTINAMNVSAGANSLKLASNAGNLLPSSLSYTMPAASEFGISTAGATSSAASAAGTGTSIASGVLSGAGAAIGAGLLVNDVIKGSKLADTSDYEKAITDVGNTTFNFKSNDDIINSLNNLPTIEKVGWKDVRGQKASYVNAALDGLSMGSGIGSFFSPIGTLIGAGAGALTGAVTAGITNATMKKRAKERAEEINNMLPDIYDQRRNNLNLAVNNMQSNQIADIMKNYAAYGGPLFNEFSNGITIINEGGSHENNPFGGVQVGIDPEGIPNLVEEGEVIFNDYVFSNRLKVDKNVRTKYKLRNTKDLTFADAAKDIQKMSEEMPNDPIVRRTTELRLNQLMQEQEMIRQKKNNNKESNQYSFGGYKKYLKRNGITLGNNVTKDNYKDQYNFKDFKDYIQNRNSDIASLSMQAAPIFGSLVAVGNDIFGGNKPDYTNVDKYETAINEAYKPIEARTLSDYIEYNPYDISFGLNKLSAAQSASRRALANTTNNPAALRAAILASDYNYGNQIGEELRRAQEYNDANRRMVADFNRGTNQFNAQAINAANQFNAQQAANKATSLGQVAQWRDQIYNANRAEKSANLTGLYEGLAGLGETFMNIKDRRYLMDNGIIVGPDGKMVKITFSQGGKIKRIKNKRRLS